MPRSRAASPNRSAACASSRATTPRSAKRRVFSEGVDRLLQNVMKSLTMTSILGSASTTVLGLVSALVMWLGGHSVLAHTWTVGDYFSYNMFLAFMIAPVFQIVNIGTQLTEAFAGLDRTGEIMAELEENQAPGRTLKMPPIHGTVAFDNVEFAYEAGQAGAARHQLRGRARHGHRAGGLLRFRQIHHHQPDVRLSYAHPAAACWSTASISRRLT